MRKLLLVLIAFCTSLAAGAQSISTVNPPFGNAGQTLDVTITGNNTSFTQATNTVNFLFTSGTSTGTMPNYITVNDDKTITANLTIPLATKTGFYAVSVENAKDGYLSRQNSFYVNGKGAPSISTISPSSANAGQTLDVTITGSNTNFTQATNTAMFYFTSGTSTATYPNSLVVNNDASLTANITVPQGTLTGYYSFAVYNSLDGVMTKQYYFYVNGSTSSNPSIASISPASGNAGQTLNVTITGNNTSFSQATNTAYFYFTSGTSTATMPNYMNVINDVELSANITIPSNTKSGYYSFAVYNDLDGMMGKTYGFYVYGNSSTPSITNVSPSSGKTGQTLDVTITGNNTSFTQATNTVRFLFSSGTSTAFMPNKITVNSNTSLTANVTIPANTPEGNYTVLVFNSIDDAMLKENAFYVIKSSSIDEPGMKKQLSISPNPFGNTFMIDVFTNESAAATIEIMDLQGRILLVEKANLVEGKNRIPITPDIMKGVYLVKLTTRNSTHIARIIKQ